MNIYEIPGGITEEEFDELYAGKRIGSKIRKIRESQGMSQAELGEKIDLNANRIQQYENGARKPKLALAQKIAKALGVETLALLDPIITSDTGAMYGLFDMEEFHNLKLVKINDKIFISFGDGITSLSPLNRFIEEWYKIQQQRDDKLMLAATAEEKEKILREYKMWEWTFPRPLIDETTKLDKKELIRQRISELQKELEDLETDSIK